MPGTRAINKAVSRVLFNVNNTPEKTGVIKHVDNKTYISAYSAAAQVLGDVQILNYSATSGQEVKVTDAAASDLENQIVGVCAKALAAAGITWFQIYGLAEAKVDGTDDVAAGDFLKITAAIGDSFITEGAAKTNLSTALAIDAQTANSGVVVTVLLLNHTITQKESESSVPTACGIQYHENGKTFISAYTADTIVLGDVQVLSQTHTDGQELTAVDPAVTHLENVLIGVCVKAITGAAITWFQIFGLVEANVDGDTVDVGAGDFLTATVAGTDAFVNDGGTATKTDISVAIAVDANAGAAAVSTVFMMGNLINYRWDVNSVPGSCGIEKTVGAKRFISAYSADAMTLGDVQVLSQTHTAGQELTAVDCAVTHLENVQVGVCAKALVGAGITWFQIYGLVEANVDGDTVDVGVGDFLSISVAGADAFINDGGTTTKTDISVAKAVDANAGAAAVSTVFMLGNIIAYRWDVNSTPTECGIVKIVGAKKFISAYTADAMVLGDVQLLTWTHTVGQEITATDGATNAIATQKIGVCVKATAGAAITWFQLFGLCEAQVDGDSVDVALANGYN
jgi:hypothetical protein